MYDFSSLQQDVSEAQQTLLIGIVIDVSNSMRRNWRNKEGKRLPRIEVIRDGLNRRIREEQLRFQSEGKQSEGIEIFCLGMGFRIPVHYSKVDLSYEQEHSLGNIVEMNWQVDIVCDLLALGEILPSQKKLADFKKQLNQKWVHCSKDILDQSIIAEDAYAQLVEYVQGALYESAIKNLHQSPLYRLSHINWFNQLFKWLPSIIRDREEKIAVTSRTASEEYADTVHQKTNRDFEANKPKYVLLIRKRLQKFAQSYTDSVLKALTLGFDITELVDDLDEQIAIEVAKRIQKDLESEVRRHIGMSLSIHEKRLSLVGRRIAASLNRKEIKRLTERFIRKFGWDILRPLIEETVLTIFSEQFEERAAENFPYWIQLASTREVIRPLGQLVNILPEVVNEHVYSEKVMFGSTPFNQALDKAAIRFIDRANIAKRKVLIIISDGEFAELASTTRTVNLLKRRGIAIVSCLIVDRNILSRLVKRSSKSWPTGAHLMLEIASKASDLSDEGIQWKEISNNQHLVDEKLCFQINHSSVLEDVLEAVFDS
jgi:hypothetical protein